MTTKLRRLLSVILCIALIAVWALITVGCSNKTEKPQTDDLPSNNDLQNGEIQNDVTVVGEGQKQFYFSVIELSGKETNFIVKTNKKTVGEALVDVKLIEGEQGAYGLYVKKVNGIVADYDVDKTYWSFNIDGEYAMTGVDKTNIEEGKSYSFKVSK
ncbi:MAG: DUF4430 domain-containing protein [Clostridia bacterium]|nr:DUF4430 domain-containing protein [Clostridia bacterium]